MHETSVARKILKQVLEQAEKEHAVRVRTVRGWVAETGRLSPDALRFQFQAYATGTPAEGADLQLDVRVVPTECDLCGARFEPDGHVLICPRCSSTQVRILEPTGLHLESIVVT